MIERRNPVPGGRALVLSLRIPGMFLCLPRLFVSAQVFLLSVLLGNPVCMRRAIVNLGLPALIIIR